VPLQTQGSIHGDIAAFARVLGERAMIELADRTFRHGIAGAEIQPTTTNSHSWLFAAKCSRRCPSAC
jgi:hypothetical protein